MTDLHNSRSVLVAVAVVFLLVSLACAKGNDALGQAVAGSEADFRLATLDGEQMGPTDFPGKVVVVDFWATWCGPCLHQAEVLDAVHEKVGDEVQFLAVDVGEEESMVRGFVAKSPFPYPVLLDSRAEVADGLGVYSLPTLMVVDTEGKVSYMEAGVINEKQVCKLVTDAGSTATC